MGYQPSSTEKTNMKIKGIKRGKAIELSQEINIPDGQEVNIEIEVIQQMSNEEKLQKMKEFLEIPWEGKEDFRKTMEELEREKRANWEKIHGVQVTE
jgi:predicted DNA-binding antitoxin AbrB/MazE fold protein